MMINYVPGAKRFRGFLVIVVTEVVTSEELRVEISGDSYNEYGLTWWRHQMETFSALLAICAGNSPVPGELPAQRPVTRSFDVLFDPGLNK